MKQPHHTKPYRGTTRGFSRASSLMQTRIRTASEQRGFAVTRLLTHWSEIVGENVANIATPINVSYGRGGMGATLSLLTTGAQAPMLEMQKENIREKVNACYGYRAIARIRITQTAPTGFSEGRVAFTIPPKTTPKPSQQMQHDAREVAQNVTSPDLRTALEALGANVLNKQRG